MMPLSTGALFLMTSMYGTGTANMAAAITPVSTQTSSTKPVTVIVQSRQSVEDYLKEKFADTPILVKIARCESTFAQFDKNGNLIRGLVDNADVGVMQINERYHTDTAKSLGYDLHTIEGNTDYAKYLYDKEGTTPWNSSSKCWSDKDLVYNK